MRKASDKVITHFLRIKLIHHISSMHIHESIKLGVQRKVFCKSFFLFSRM